MYSLVWFLALLLAWSTFALANHGPRWYLVLLWSLAGASGLLTHYFFVFIWLACFAWLWLHPGALSRAHLTGAAVLMGLLILPWYLQIPGSLSRWRVTGGWLANPLSWKQALSSPFILAWSQLSGRGPWGGSFWADCLAAGLYGLLIVVILRQGLRHLFSKPRLMLWLWLFASCLGPALFDLIMHTCASTIPRYALPALPVAMLIAALGINSLPRKKQVAFILLILLAWLPGIHGLYSSPSRPWESYPAVTARLEASIQPADLAIVHSIPSGILGVARYMGSSTPIASWVVQLEQRRVPADLEALLADRRKVALIKIHDLNNPSPAEVWLREHSTLEDHYIWHPPPRASGWPKSEILFFSPAQGEMFSP